MKKIILCTLLIITSVFILASCQKKEEIITQKISTDFPDYEAGKDKYKFLMSGYFSPTITEENMQDYFDCGFDIFWINGNNVGYGASAVNNTKKALEIAESMNKKCVIDASVSKAASELSNSLIANDWGYQDYSSLFAVDAFDEPICFGGTNNSRTSIDDLSEYITAYEAIYGTDIPYFANLLPLSSTILGSDYPTYISNYVENILMKLDPSMEKWISCDTYCLIYDAAKDKYMLKDSWLGNLQMIADTKLDYPSLNIKTNFFILSSPHTTGSTNHDREIGYNELRLQLYTLMAFGYDMASFFCYANPPGGDGEEYRESLLDSSGNKTSIYDASQKIMSELESFSYVVKQFEYRGVYAVTGSKYNYSNDNFEYLELLKEDNLGLLDSSEASADTLIGCLRDKNENDGYVIVNMNDPYYECADKVTLSFGDSDHAYVYKNGKRTSVELDDGVLELNLGIGEGVFVIPYVE